MSENIGTCKNCGNRFSGRYCNKCGEKVYHAHDKSVLHFFEEVLHFFTHIEGTFVTTLKAIFLKPGKLSLDYCYGIRKKYFKPLPFFMLLVVLYLIFPFFEGLNMPFSYYLNRGSYSSHVTSKKTGVDVDSLITSILPALEQRAGDNANKAFAYRVRYIDSVIKQTPALAKVNAAFNKKSEKTSKVLLLILIPLTAMVVWLLSLRKTKYFFDSLVFATEINSFYLIFSFFIVPLVTWISFKVAPHLAFEVLTDSRIGIFSYCFFGIFSAVAFRRFYRDKWWWSVTKAILLVVAHYYIVQLIYKFILFAITFYLSA